MGRTRHYTNISRRGNLIEIRVEARAARAETRENFKTVIHRLTLVENRLGAVENTLGQMETRLGLVETGVNDLKQRITSL